MSRFSAFCFRISRALHKYLGLTLLLYLAAMGLSGLLLNNPGPIGDFAVPWSWTPANYQPQHWNRMYLRQGVVRGDHWFLAGKPGVAYSGDGGRNFTLLGEGFPAGPYGRDTNALLVRETPAGHELFAATRAGLFRRGGGDGAWQPLALPGAGPRPPVADIIATPDRIVAFSHYGIYAAVADYGEQPEVSVADQRVQPKLSGHGLPQDLLPRDRLHTGPLAGASQSEYHFQAVEPRITADQRPPVPWFRILHDFHNGKIIGPAGKWLLDLLGLGLLFLALSALVIWYVPWRNRRFKSLRRRPGRLFNCCWPYHLKVGIYAGAFLAVLAVSGALLRPPLLIAVAPYALAADHPLLALSPRSDAWGGKLQKALYSSASDTILVATEGGFFQGPADFSRPFRPRRVPVPVHGMGVTVLAEVEPGRILIGSFMGLYLWDERSDRVERLPRPGLRGGKPYQSNDLLTAVVMADGQPRYRVDYHDGMMPLVPQMADYGPAMPPEISRQTPMSLWHWLFEFHNGRIFEQWLGMWYLLLVPLGATGLLLVGLTGLYDWFHRRR